MVLDYRLSKRRLGPRERADGVLLFERPPYKQSNETLLLQMKATEQPRVVRWIQFPAAVLVFLVVPGDPESGAFYVYDRRSGTWFWVDFEDSKFGGYNESDFERLVRQSQFLRLVERPWLLESDGKWFVQTGDRLLLHGGQRGVNSMPDC